MYVLLRIIVFLKELWFFYYLLFDQILQIVHRAIVPNPNKLHIQRLSHFDGKFVKYNPQSVY